jgi:hypothetical protein
MNRREFSNKRREQDPCRVSSSAATRGRKECQQMFVEDPQTSLPAGPPTVLEGDVAYGLRSAKPIDLWDAWLFAAAESSLMLDAWRRAASEQRVDAYAGYHAALDREEQAAFVLAERLRTCLEGA